jgi:HK97 family phage major capsid protein
MKNTLYDVSTETTRLVTEIEKEHQKSVNAGNLDLALGLSYSYKLARAIAQDTNSRYVESLNNEKKESPSTLAKRASNEYLGKFIQALQHGTNIRVAKQGYAEEYRLLLDVITETGGTPAGSEGGFLAPVFFDGVVYQQMRQYLDIAQYVATSDVLSFKGWRAVEKEGPALPLDEMVEGEEIPEAESPEFKAITFQLKKYGGFLPAASDLFTDSPVNIMEYLATWWARKVVVTNNQLIIARINELTPVDVTDYKTLISVMKTVLNRTLDPLISANSAIFCNQTGFDLMDSLVDGTGRSILQPDPAVSTPMSFLRRPVVMLSDEVFENISDDGDFAPIAIGNGREYITLFRRGVYEMTSTSESKTAWRNHNTEVRGIMRADPEIVDTEAMVLLKVSLPA